MKDERTLADRHPPECVCTPIGPYDGYSGVVAHYSGPPPIWISADCPVHGHLEPPQALRSQPSVEAIEAALRDMIYLQTIDTEPRVVGYEQAARQINSMYEGKG